MKSKAKPRAPGTKRARAPKSKAAPTVYVVEVNGRGDHGDVIIERMALHPLGAAPRTTRFGPRLYPFRAAYRLRAREGNWLHGEEWMISCRGEGYGDRHSYFLGTDDADAIQWLLEGEVHRGG